MTLKRLLEKFKGIDKDDIEQKIKPYQRVRIRMDISPQTFVTRIEDMDKDNIYIAGITEQELNFTIPCPNQKMEIYVFSDNLYYKTETFFKRKINQPVYLWVLKKPRKLKIHGERRSTFRLENVVEANFQVASTLFSQKGVALTKNISVGGLAIISQVNLPLKTRIQIHLPAISNITLDGELVWRYERPYFDRWYYGVRFLDVEPRAQTVITQYINQRLNNLKWLGV